ncbi:hypothetical protein WJX73_003759 [Symbiochloris irregularis]|uniref:Uncharacterized protein n=1 Tax=Symbiochloris irregularis TaxID=706552 RepID=A0AAW1PQS6_9CHLO
MKRKRRSQAAKEQLHAPRSYVTKLLETCMQQARAFAPRDILAIYQGAAGLNRQLNEVQLLAMDAVTASCLPQFNSQDLESFLELRTKYSQELSATLKSAMLQEWPSQDAQQRHIEAEASDLRPYGLQQAAHALGCLLKAGVAIPPSTTASVARQAQDLAPFWDLPGASTILGSAHRLMGPTLWDDGDRQDTKAAVQQMACSLLEAQANRIMTKQKQTGSWTMLGGKRRPVMLANVLNIGHKLGASPKPVCQHALLTTLSASTLAGLSMLDVADLMEVLSAWGQATQHLELVDALALMATRNWKRASSRTQSQIRQSLALLQKDLPNPSPRMQGLTHEMAFHR